GCFLNAIGPSFFADAFSGGAVQAVRVQVASSGSSRQVDFSIEQIGDLSVKFENRVLSLDSNSVCSLKVSLAAKISLMGVKWAQPDVSKENGDPEKGESDIDSGNKAIKEAYNTMLDELISPDANSDSSKKSILDGKRKKIIEAIKEVCKSCCCNRKEDEFCIKPDDVSQAVKDVCKDCCCKNKESCVDSSKIMDEVKKLCVDCCCKKDDCCGTKEVLSQIGDFCVCVIKEAKEKLENCTCSGCSSCQENCIDKQKLMKEIEQLCSCDKAKKVVEQAPQKCSGCSGSGSCQCCEAAKKQFESCPCMACDLKRVIDDIKGSGENGSNCCNSSSCSCSSDSNSNCRTKDAVLTALKTYCKCDTQVKEIKKKIEKLCQSCKSKTCCDTGKIESQIEQLCNSCPCKTHPKCCNENEIQSKVQQVIEKHCTCKKNKCCFKDINDGDLSSNTTEQTKLKNIAKAIFKYFRPPIAHSTGVMTLKSTADIDLQFSSGSSSSQDNITVDAKNKNVLKIPKQAFKDLIASTKINQVKVTTFHKNTMLSIHFEEISLTFQKLNGTGFEIDGYPINGTFSMQLGYQPIGPFTKNSANMRKKTENEPKKHNLSWGISSNHPRIDPSKCSCSILSDPLFGTVFGAICLTISIVQFIIALFVSQGYYDGFQSYMDAVRSGFSWPTQYDNVASSIFWYGYLSTPTLGTYAAVSGCFLNAIGPSFFADDFSGGAVQSVRVLVGTRNVPNTQLRNVEFCIQELQKEGLTVTFEDRLLSLDPNVSCKLKVSLHAKINLVGSRFSEPDTTKDNGDPDKNGSDPDINEAYQKMLDDLVNFSSNDQSKVNTMKSKRKNIIEAIKAVCQKDCSCGSNCCFKDITDGDLSKHSAEQSKLKEIAKNIFKYFRPPIAYETGVMTLSSETKELCISSSSSTQDNITVDKGNGNVLNTLKIPKKAFEKLMASTKMHENKVKDFHPNSMLSIKFEEICLTFQEFTGTGFCIDGYSINGSFSMIIHYSPAGIFTRPTANWRKKTENEPKKHDLNWKLSEPKIIEEQCSCSILSDPLFGTVFGAICLTISIVQFIIALFVSQGYYDGFQSYMDAVRSGFSWPTQYDNVVSSIFWWLGIGVRNGSQLLLGISISPSLGTYEAVRVLVGSSGNHRNVDFSIEQLNQDLSVMFENRVLSLDPNVSCKLKVSLLAKITLVGVKWAQPDTTKENGDPEKGDSDPEITVINSAYNTMLDELISPDANSDSSKTTMDKKRKNIIDAIKDVCQDCCCNRKDDEYCVKPTDISQAVKQVCANCCCKQPGPCVDSSKIMNKVKELCQNCCCKQKDCCGTEGVENLINKFACCILRDVQSYVEGQKGNNNCQNTACKTECCNYSRVTSQIAELCPSSDLKTMVQTCINCNGGHSTGKCCCGTKETGCNCCKQVKEKLEGCDCTYCQIKDAVEDLKNDNCCPSPLTCCNGDANKCVKASDIYDKVMDVCGCKTELDKIKTQVKDLCKQCNQNNCCDASKIQSDIQDICNDCDCKQRKDTCCNETQINEKVKKVIKEKCTCKKNKCCFNGVQNGTISNTAEQTKLKNIAKNIFKYFRPPIAHETGVMTLKSTTDIELEFLSSSSNEKITVDTKNKNVLKIPKQAFKDLMASFQIPQVKVTTFHKNTMLSIHFEEISLTFQN
ncbi:uncharacterized protein BdWA1_003941, partial [Babesia duncani]